MRTRVMTNPSELLLAGNPGKKRTTAAGRAWAKKMAKARAVKAGLAPPSRGPRRKAFIDKHSREYAENFKEPAVAKRRKSKKSRAARVAKRREKRARRKSQPAGLKRYWAKKRAKASSPKRARRSRRSRLKVKRSKVRRRSPRIRARRRRAARRHVKNVVASRGTRVVVRKVARGRVRHARKRSGRRVGVVGVNAGSLSLTGGITGFVGNAKATMNDGVKGFAFAFGGAAASVVGGGFASQVTGNLLAKFAPSLLSNPIVQRLVGAVNYYLPGWAASKFIPGLSGKSRRAMLTGAAAAALIEVVRPGLMRKTMARVPVVGQFLSGMEDQAEDLGAYVGYALNGNENNHDGQAYVGSGMADEGVSDYVSLGDYYPVQGDAAQDMGVADYVALR